jgi:hypothetical protein
MARGDTNQGKGGHEPRERTRTTGKGNPRVVSQSGSFKNKKRLLFIDLPACIKKDRSCVSFSDLIILNIHF